MPLHPPQASQARCSSSIALTGDGAPSRGLSVRSVDTARRMFTPHRATSSCVGRLVARIDASAKRTAGASDRSVGNGMTAGADMGRTVGCVGVRNGRGLVNTSPLRVGVLTGKMSKTLTRGMAPPTPKASEQQTSCNLYGQAFAVSAILVKNAWSTSFTSEWASEAVPSRSRSAMSSTWPLTFRAAMACRDLGIARMMLSARAVATPRAISSFSDGSVMAALIGAHRAGFNAPKVARVSAVYQRSAVNFDRVEIVAPALPVSGQ